MKELIFLHNVPNDWNINNENITINELRSFIFTDNCHHNHYYFQCIQDAFNNNLCGQSKSIAYNIVKRYNDKKKEV